MNFASLTPSRTTGELYVGGANTSSAAHGGHTSGFTYDVTSAGLFAFDPSVTTSIAPSASQSLTGAYLTTSALVVPSVFSTAPTSYSWNSNGQLCNVSAGSGTPCGSTPATGTAYTYNGDGLRMTETVSTTSTTTVTDSTWDTVAGGTIPLNINDAATTGSTTTNTSYIYGDLLFGGTAPIEQIVTLSSGASVSYLVSSPQGVQGVYSATGAVQEMALYSTYGIQSLSAGTAITPFGFQGSYTDQTGLIYVINRYYDPSTDQFLSIDPLVDETGQPYAFTNDNPLNSTDPLGLSGSTSNKKLRKKIQSLQRQIKLHEDKLESDPDNPAAKHWQTEINGWKKQVRNLERRLNTNSSDAGSGSSGWWGVVVAVVEVVVKVGAGVVCGAATSETGPGAVVAGASCAGAAP
ncbi:MAG TPA: RHS repeat-associated core domain-containing protein [Acidimicrobiales bacterium]|nr:RHS repeat-associated core domain-containing protein [Acidimicrobiales bacterium]